MERRYINTHIIIIIIMYAHLNGILHSSKLMLQHVFVFK